MRRAPIIAARVPGRIWPRVRKREITMSLPFHPLSEIFPLIEGKEFDELVADIKLKGLLHPIVLHEGMILEGRNRARACEAAGVEPITKMYEGTDPIGFIYSANIARRHLEAAQRAMIAAELSNLDQGTTVPLTVEQAATLAKVSTGSIKRARVVLMNGTRAEIDSVKTGEVGLHPVASTVRSRSKDKKSRVTGNRNLRRGVPVNLPDGAHRLSLAVKPGIELERAGTSALNAAKQIGISTQAYTCVRDIVLLSKRKDLSDHDLKTVQAALVEIDETRRVKHAQESIKPISLKVWGRNGNRFRADKARVSAFTDSIMFVVTGCTAIADAELPVLEKTGRTKIIKDISGAISALTKLRRRLKKEEHK